MQINFIKTHPNAVIPTRGSAGAAGFDLTAVSLRHLDEMRKIIEACGNPIRKRRTSAGAQRDLHAACDAMYESYRFPSDPSEKVDRWAALFCAADLMICGAAGMCPNYTSTPDWWKLRRLSDKWVTGLMEMCPGCDEEGDKIYTELVA